MGSKKSGVSEEMVKESEVFVCKLIAPMAIICVRRLILQRTSTISQASTGVLGLLVFRDVPNISLNFLRVLFFLIRSIRREETERKKRSPSSFQHYYHVLHTLRLLSVYWNNRFKL